MSGFPARQRVGSVNGCSSARQLRINRVVFAEVLLSDWEMPLLNLSVH